MRTRLLFPLWLCTVLAACAASRSAHPASEVEAGSNAIIIHSRELSSTVLQSIRNKVPNMRVSTGQTRCPRIVFRAERSVTNQRDPSVYIDGTHMMDTCSLLDLAVTDIEHIEIYTGGNTPYPQIERNPFGLILIFRHRE